MTNLGVLMARCRTRANLNQRDAAELIGTSMRQLQRYENEGYKVPEDIALKAAVIYRAPEIITEYVNSGPIGQVFGGLSLDGINQNHVAALVKYREELKEALEAVDALIKLTINNISEDLKGKVTLLYEQAVADVKTAITQTEKALMLLAGVDVGIEAHKNHKEKCIKRGYKLKKEKRPALCAEKPATYQLA